MALFDFLFDEQSVKLPGPSQFELDTQNRQSELFGTLGTATRGIAAEDIAGARGDLFSQLRDIGQKGFLPEQVDTQTAARLFKPRQQALQDAFRSQTTESNRLAARLGRSVNDPILQARLRSSQAQQSAQLGAEQSAAALGIRQQRLGFLQQAGNLGLQDLFKLAGLQESAIGREQSFRQGLASQHTDPGLLSVLGPASAIFGAAGTGAAGFAKLGG